MAKTSEIALVLGVLVVMVLIGMEGGAKAMTICNMDSSQLAQCLPSIKGPSPTPPTQGCCDVMKIADMHCLCTYKAILPTFGVDPKLAMGLPKKCNLNAPPECDGNLSKPYPNKPLMVSSHS
ncbi:Bifunctional inhibitor/plant lipid transfer protein/seed storage helical domain [Macleaya cordata]|uniref:Bifunctional inhibitor/plant lipid transfer protein/seed storage helical domain n=1 Tax=Macleaya cordata TaxID=56857 RepID=A0A200Q7Z3_MACCD|nr:Bifunctional inhibitor/plant lipid transfer protein/seed storage helical domain [Macleaya cordata]